jgi:hypothetical protein
VLIHRRTELEARRDYGGLVEPAAFAELESAEALARQVGVLP